MAKSDERRRQAAKAFVERWMFRRGSEKGEDQQFWNDLLRSILGVDDVESRIRYQVPVPMGGSLSLATAKMTGGSPSPATAKTTKFLDAWIPETRVLIEHKSRGVDLSAPQPGHGGLTPYEQACEYDNARPFDEKARWIVTCNFDRFEIHDRARPLAPPLVVRLRDLPKEAHRLAFLVDPKEKAVDRELEISVQAGRIVGELYDALLERYGGAPDALAALNRLCVRLVFCLYAEDAGVFPKDCFRRLVEASDAHRLRRDLLALFRVLDTPVAERDPYLEPELAAFPYTNGGLFKVGGCDDIPPLTEEIRQLLLGASRFDWREITPTIFGALFESTLNPETRRSGGMVYTSVENIHKVIDPLFLDDLTAELDEILASRKIRRLAAFQDKLASLTFLDPACGSGNFLTETYLSLRRLENRLIAARQGGQGEFDLGADLGAAKVTLAQFRGIEVNDFAVAVAKTALWIAEAQMRRETAEILHREPDYLPLKDFGGIVEGNALRLDWPRADFIMGNPPFVGHQYRSREQAADMDFVYADWKDVNYGKLDYVCAWYHKAAALMRGTATRAAFVSTNSICQGEQVAAMWKPLFERAGVVIDYAWRTFRWDSEAAEKAAVHCVIVGFHAEAGEVLDRINRIDRIEGSGVVGRDVLGAPPRNPVHPVNPVKKTIYSSDGTAHAAANVNGYLVDAPTVFIENRGKPPAGLPIMTKGSQPTDGGNLILSPAERDEILAKHPEAADLIRRYIGADDFINSRVRYCLWLKGVAPNRYRGIPQVMERLARVAEMRRRSPTKSVQRDADTPMLFTQIRQPETDYLVIPRVSSERRLYIPMAYVKPEVIVSDSAIIVSDATPFLFGILTSSVHMAWMRMVAGRLEMRYRYTPAVYNNFPWPTVGDVEKWKSGEVEKCVGVVGRGVLDAPSGVVGSRIPRDRDEPGRREGLQGQERREGEIIEYSNNRIIENPVNPVNPVSNDSSRSPDLHGKIASTAQAILSARSRYPGSSLADLYDPLTMPPDLRSAHAANDRAVLAAYGLAADTPEPEIVAHLFRLYAGKARGLE